MAAPVSGHQHGAPTSGAAAPPTTPAGAATTYASAAEVTAQHKIVMTDNRNTPAALTVPADGTVAWINSGANLHTATAFDLSFESGSVPAGKAWSFTFTRPGTYNYFCRQHFLNGMGGVVTVQ